MTHILDIVVPLAVFALLLFFAIYGIYFLWHSFEEDYRFTTAYNLIKTGVTKKNLDENKVQSIYNRTYKKFNNHSSYADFLERIIFHSREKYEKSDLISDLTAFLKPIIDKEKIEQPFANVNEKERNTLFATENAALKNDMLSVKKNLDELSSIIARKQKSLSKAKKINILSLVISAIGILVTIFIWIHGTSLNEDDITKISEKTSEIILNAKKTTSNETKEPIQEELNKATAEDTLSSP